MKAGLALLRALLTETVTGWFQPLRYGRYRVAPRLGAALVQRRLLGRLHQRLQPVPTYVQGTH